MAFLIWDEIGKNKVAWQQSGLSNKQYLEQEFLQDSGLHLGCSFVPERWGYRDDRAAHTQRVLEKIVVDLGVNNIRLGLRWDQIEREPRRMDFSLYQPFIDYCIRHHVHLTLGVGPLKTCGWPEEHLPGWVIQQLSQVPKPWSWVQPSSELALLGLDYMDRLLQKIKQWEQAGLQISLLQPDNEPFNPFGTYRFRCSQEYLLQAIEIISANFPTTRLLLNSNARFNLRSILNLIRAAGEQGMDGSRFRVGFDYYYTDQWRARVPGHRYLDSISLSLPFDPDLNYLRRQSRSLGFDIEVSEAQMEPWTFIQTPGNSASELRYVIQRCLEGVLDRDQSSFNLIRLWGVEQLVERFLEGTQTVEHEQMWELIRLVNGKVE